MTCTFNQWVFLKCSPKMFCKPMTGQSFVLVPFEQVANGRNPSWQYALVNVEEKMHKMLFTSEGEVIDALFKAKEIWYGTDKHQNWLYGKADQMKVEYDLACQQC